MNQALLVAKNDTAELCLLPAMANRHGLITGATGTGKTVTLQSLAEQFSNLGVPCFMSDVKGDLSGIAQPGGDNPKVNERLEKLGLKDTHTFQAHPVTLWDPNTAAVVDRSGEMIVLGLIFGGALLFGGWYFAHGARYPTRWAGLSVLGSAFVFGGAYLQLRDHQLIVTWPVSGDPLCGIASARTDWQSHSPSLRAPSRSQAGRISANSSPP